MRRMSLPPALPITALALALAAAKLGGGEMAVPVLAVGTIGLWASAVIPESLTGLIFLTFAVLAKLAPVEVVFSGYASSAFWLIFSGLVIGAAIKHSGLGDRIAAAIARMAGGSWPGALAAAALFGLGMAFVMPSAMGRIALMLPILAALAEHLGQDKSSRGHAAIMLAGVFGTYLPSSAILPANVPNNVLAGIVELTLGRRLTFGDYFLTHFPVLGLLKAALLIVTLLVRYGGEGSQGLSPTSAQPIPWSCGERRLALILALALALWATDGVHGIAPAWVGMAAAIVCLLPGVGVMPPKALQSLNFEPLIYVGAIIGLGALIARVGLGAGLAHWAMAVMALEPGHPTGNFIQLGLLSFLVGLLTTLPGMPAVLTPLTPSLAQASGLGTAAVLAAQVLGFSTVLLPYQAPPLVMAAQAGNLPRRELAWMCVVSALLGLAVLLPLQALWLAFIGVL